jgi:biotin transport system substrate-specific component
MAGAGSLVTLAMGATWLGIWQHMTPGMLMGEAVLPFLPGDVLKVVAAAGIAAGAERWKKHRDSELAG